MSRPNVSAVVYFGGIPNDWDTEVVKSVVCGTGRIVEVRCMMEMPDRNRGYSFIEYATPEEAQHAIELLPQIRVIGGKKLRLELSKEGIRVNGMEKPVLPLNRNFLPPNVVLPEEMLQNGPMPTQQQQQQPQAQSNNILDQLPPEFVQLMTTNTQFQQVVTQMINNGQDLQQILELTRPFFNNNNNNNNNTPQQNVPAFQQQAPQYQTANQLPDFLRNASSYLPKEPLGIFKSEETNDASLKKLEPPMLIQLITNLKEVVDSSNSYNAIQVIKGNPDLAVASAQLLLLMGFIDTDVIQEAMQQATPTPAAPPLPPTPPVDPNWAGFQEHTIQKLLKLDKSQADMILQVLKMAPAQIALLPPDQRAMVDQLRLEYT